MIDRIQDNGFMRLVISLLLALAGFAVGQTVKPPHWPQFRGPLGDARGATRPASLAFDLAKDVAWKVKLPIGHSSPCIWGDRIFLTGLEDGKLLMLALDRRDGREIWRRGVALESGLKFDHVDATVAMPTPCTNGERIFFYFGAYGLLACDRDGALVWEKRLPVSKSVFGTGTSPMLVDDLLILVRDGHEDSAIYAFAEKDGVERWKIPRLTYIETYSTPYLWRNQKRRELVIAGSRRIAAFEPATGNPIWEIHGLTDVICPTPSGDRETLYFAAWSTGSAAGKERFQSIFGDAVDFTPEERSDGGAAFRRLDANGDKRLSIDEFPPSRAKDCFEFCDQNGNGTLEPREFAPIFDAPKGRGVNMALAIKAGGQGDITKTHLLWKRRRGIPYVASPLLYQGRVYLMKSGGILSCLDAATGEPHFDRVRLEDHSEYYSSPLGFAGHVIFCSRAGTIQVLKARDEFEVVTKVELGERIFATPAIVDGRIYIRSSHHLWAFGRKKERR